MIMYAVASGESFVASVLPSASSEAANLFVSFDPTWQEYPTRYACFAVGDASASEEVLLADNACTIPTRLLADGNVLSVFVKAADADGTKTKCSASVSVKVQGGAVGVVLADPVPDLCAHMASLTATLAAGAAIAAKPYISFIPLTDYYVSDTEQRLYFNEIAQYDPNGYFKVTADGVSYPEVTVGTNGVSDYISFCVTSVTEFSLTVHYFYRGTCVEKLTFRVHVCVKELPVKKYLFIGDSLTDAGTVQNFFKSLNGENVILYGTRGEGEFLHEGRGSWGITHYFTPAKGEVKNPFYNPETETFDFGYYMKNHPEFADVDVVNIFLGRNNGFNLGVMDKIDIMVSSIKAFREDIIITLMGAYNVAPDNTGTGRYLQSADDFNYAAHLYNKAFYERYAKSEDVFLIPAHLNLDNKYDYTLVEEPISAFDERTVLRYNNNVHPDKRGYRKLGVAVSAFFRHFWSR